MKQLFLYLLVLSTVVARAQKNYVPAIIIDQHQDSLRGFVDYRNWRISPDEISFKKDLSAEEQHFRPSDISGFLVVPANELYVSRFVKVDITRQTLDHLLDTDERDYKNDTLFLLSIVKGAYGLYVYTDKHDQPHYLYDAPGKPIEELRLIKRRIPDGSTAIMTLNHYQQQLAILFGDCESVSKRAGRVNYTENALRGLFVDYHQCRNPSEKIMVKEKEKMGVQWGPLVGIGANNYKFRGRHPMANADFKSSVTPLLGLFINIPLSRNRHQYWCGAELFYKVEEANGSLVTGNILEKWTEHVNMKFSYAQVNLLFRYIYPKGAVRPFANIGWGNGLLIGENKNLVYRTTSGGSDEKEAIDGPRKHETTILGGAGVQYGRLQFEARYAWSNGFSPYVTLGVGVHSWQGVVRFAL